MSRRYQCGITSLQLRTTLGTLLRNPRCPDVHFDAKNLYGIMKNRLGTFRAPKKHSVSTKEELKPNQGNQEKFSYVHRHE